MTEPEFAAESAWPWGSCNTIFVLFKRSDHKIVFDLSAATRAALAIQSDEP